MWDDEPVSDLTWAERQFRDEPSPRRRFLQRRGVAAAAFVFCAFVFLFAVQHEGNRCGNACLDIGGSSSISGQPWTWYDDAWQWQLQWGLALLGIMAGFAGLIVGSRFAHRRTAGLLTAAGTLLAVAWIVWRVLEPGIPQ
jgi:hypothetical protein